MAITDSLMAYYALESDGTDSSGRGNTLTLTNTPTFAAGINGNDMSLASASTQYGSIASNSDFVVSPGESITVSAWVKPATLVTHGIAGKFSTIAPGNSNGEWGLLNTTGTGVRFQTRNAANTTSASAIVAYTEVADTWYFVIGGYYAALGRVWCRVNNGTTVWTTSSGVNAASQAFAVGRNASSNYLNGMIGEVGVWKRYVYPAEQKALYNLGVGRFYPFANFPYGLLMAREPGIHRGMMRGMR